MHSGTISRAELQSGVISRPYAFEVPSPNQTIGALDAASTNGSEDATYRPAAAAASRCRNWYWKITRHSAMAHSTVTAARKPGTSAAQADVACCAVRLAPTGGPAGRSPARPARSWHVGRTFQASGQMPGSQRAHGGVSALRAASVKCPMIRGGFRYWRFTRVDYRERQYDDGDINR